ncbi:MAG: cytochrome c3 family protein [Bacteroidia bacterium]|nr:c-type cytochrome [Bacteroidia bacterium]MDW8158606.1 cytochrome c3 family protein [Bacteroidia bacterium]
MLKRILFAIITGVLLFLVFLGGAAYCQDGEALFKANCASCHKVDKKMTGPALKGVHDRWDNQIEEMIAFVKNSQAYMKAGRPKSDYAKKLYAEYNNTLMPAQALKDEEIKAIFDYILAYKAPDAATAGAPAAADEKKVDPSVYYSILTLVVVLLVVCILLAIVVGIVVTALVAKEKRGVLNWETFTASARGIFRNKFVLTVVGLVVILGVLNSTIDFAANINFNQNYQPVQPIAFSHKLHAGQYQIDCKYCHIGVEKGKSATIPSTNICMNCHNAIEEGPKYGRTEIAKIYESYQNNKPIEWVKIHNLPDLVYFSHAQHVKVAGLECQECHGPVEQMEEVYQYAKLSMGWCVDCHRKKEVDINKDDYYRSIHAQLREDLKQGKIKKITVETLGGLECARCHY